MSLALLLGVGHAQVSRSKAELTLKKLPTHLLKYTATLTKRKIHPKKTMAAVAVRGLEEEANKGEHVDESKVEEWFTTLMAMLPDIGEVAINTFINPISGLSTVFQKIANKAKGTLEVR